MKITRLILFCLLALFAGARAQAAIVSFVHESTISYTNISGLSSGQPISITMNMDNGASTLISQTWSASDLLSVVFNANNGAYVVTFVTPFDGGLGNSIGSFETDASGTLIAAPSSYTDSNVVNDIAPGSSGPSPFIWYIDGANGILYNGDSNSEISINNEGNDIKPEFWSISTVPEPKAYAGITGLCCLALMILRRRQVISI